jgi:hypothetical protein
MLLLHFKSSELDIGRRNTTSGASDKIAPEKSITDDQGIVNEIGHFSGDDKSD